MYITVHYSRIMNEHQQQIEHEHEDDDSFTVIDVEQELELELEQEQEQRIEKTSAEEAVKKQHFPELSTYDAMVILPFVSHCFEHPLSLYEQMWIRLPFCLQLYSYFRLFGPCTNIIRLFCQFHYGCRYCP